MYLIDIILFVSSVINVSIGLFVYFKNKNAVINRAFCVFMLGLAVWGSSLFMARMLDQMYFWVRMAFSGIALSSSAFLHFSIIFPGRNENKINKIGLLLIYLLPPIFFILNPLIIKSCLRLPIGFKIVYGPLYPVYMFYMISFFIIGFSFLVKKYRHSYGVAKLQIKYLFLGIFLSFIIAMFTNVILPNFGNSKLSGIGPSFTIFISGFTAYAILRHRLMDIEVVIKKSIVYSALVGTISASYILLTLLFGQILQRAIGHASIMAIFLTAVIIVAGYKPLEEFLESVTDKIFFKGKHDYRKALREISKKICCFINLDQLLSLVVGEIAKTVKIDKVSILLREDDVFWVGLKNEYKTNAFQISKIETKLCRELNDYLVRQGELILADEIEDAEVKKNLEELNAAICVPLFDKGGLIGMLNIGNKLSEDPYSVEDLELLSTLANQAAIAIENAKLVEKEKDMTQRLDQSKRLASLGGFAGRLIHEIRNPLVSIKAFFEVFSDKNENEEDKRELSELASQEIIRVEGLLDNLLSFAKPPKPRFLHEDIFEILNETINQLKPETALRHISLYIEKKEDHIPRVTVDRKQIKQVFLNVIYNALQAMPEKGGQIAAKIAYRPDENRVAVTFQDNGCGIHPQDINKLFDPFYSTKSGGTGLGLAVSYNIINSHKGEIDVVSEQGKGTTVEIILPIL